MDWQKVKQWINKYYEGVCSLKEEEQLKQAFRRDDVPAELQADKAMFTALNDYHDTPSPAFNIEKAIHEAIDREDKKTRFIFSPTTQWFLRIAAVFVIIAGGYFVVQQQQSQVAHEENISADTYENPELAYLEAKKALLYISHKMNTGTDELQNLGKFSEGFENLTKLGAFDKATNLVSDETEKEKKQKDNNETK